MKRLAICLLICIIGFSLSAQEKKEDQNQSKENTEITEPESIKTIDLDAVAQGKMKAGIELGYPFSGITIGYRFTDRTEWNLLIGSVLDFDHLALGTNFLFTLVKLETNDLIFPLSLGPAVFTEIQTDQTDYYAGVVTRLEYNFEAPANLYLQVGAIVSLSIENPEIYWPFSLGIRYIF